MDVEEIREQKMEELKQKQAQQMEVQRKEAEAEAQIDAIVKRLLDDGARARLSNVRLVNKELYLRAVQAIMAFYQSGRLAGKLNEEQLKEILATVSTKRETQIRRK